MKVLLDTNIIIHREASKVINQEIGNLFFWLDKLHYSKCIHPLTQTEIGKYSDPTVVNTMSIKLDNYHTLKTEAPLDDKVKEVSTKIDSTTNDLGDTKLLNEVYCNRVDILISEDKKIHTKASLLGLSDRVYRIDSFLEKVISENPDLTDYNVLAVKRQYFGNVTLKDSFFDSFREDYKEFDLWYNKKGSESCYVCYHKEVLSAFLFVKPESEDENYSNITPPFVKRKRLKIGTLKVVSNGFKIGERFLKIIFDNALKQRVEEIYVTIFDKRQEQLRLISLLEEWGFKYHGIKKTANGEEKVFTREFKKDAAINKDNPKFTYPFLAKDTDIYIVKIEPQYHSELFPDSHLTTESPMDFTENEPHRNALSKVYVSHSEDRNLKSGDIILIYRIGETTPKKYSSTITTICIVESVINNLKSFEELLNACRKRTVIKDEELKIKFWDKFPTYKPFVINFLYAHSFPTPKPTLNDLNKIGVIPDIANMSRGFIKITREQFDTLVKFAYKTKK
jgi:hypothetical protein